MAILSHQGFNAPSRRTVDLEHVVDRPGSRGIAGVERPFHECGDLGESQAASEEAGDGGLVCGIEDDGRSAASFERFASKTQRGKPGEVGSFEFESGDRGEVEPLCRRLG